jgi:RNA polymerase sigma-70 factor (ECF subfamily)
MAEQLLVRSAGAALSNQLALNSAGALSDEQIIERVLGGETHLFEVVMRRYNTRLYRAARAILKNDAEAEDVMQDAYVRAFQHLHQFAGRSKFSTWLTRIAIHEALARMHKAKRFEEFDDMNENKQNSIGAAQTRPTPESESASGELNRLLEQAIANLPDNYRAVVLLRDVEEMNTSETAACLAITEENVKIRLHRAHALLRRELYAKAKICTAETFPFHAVRCDRVVSAVFAVLEALRAGSGDRSHWQ